MLMTNPQPAIDSAYIHVHCTCTIIHIRACTVSGLYIPISWILVDS